MGPGAVVGLSLLVSLVGAGVMHLTVPMLRPKPVVEKPVAAPVQQKPVIVPDVSSLTIAAARTQAADAGLAFVIEGAASTTKLDEARVSSQQPLPGSLVWPQTAVRVQIGSASAVAKAAAAVEKKTPEPASPPKIERVATPNITGLEVPAASLALKTAGLALGLVQEQESSERRGTILSQLPTAGDPTAKGSTVVITIAARAPKVEVPRLTNKRADAARRILKELGVRARIRRVFHDVIETGHVIRTRPGVGAKVDPDTFIDVYVAE